MQTETETTEKKKTVWYSTPRAKRKRKIVQFTLDPTTIAHLKELTKGQSRSLYIESLIAAAFAAQNTEK